MTMEKNPSNSRISDFPSYFCLDVWDVPAVTTIEIDPIIEARPWHAPTTDGFYGWISGGCPDYSSRT